MRPSSLHHHPNGKEVRMHRHSPYANKDTLHVRNNMFRRMASVNGAHQDEPRTKTICDTHPHLLKSITFVVSNIYCIAICIEYYSKWLWD